MATEPISIKLKPHRRKASGHYHGTTAELLIREYLGDEVIDSTPRSVDDTFQGKKARKRGEIANLAQHFVKDEAAAKIQKSFRRFRSEDSLRRTSFGKFGQEAVELIKTYKQEGGTLREEPFASKIKLILNFDVNKTIIMSDKVQDGDMSFMVNSLLAECAWGRLEAGPVWVPVGRLATDRPTNDPRLMTYNSFLDSFLLPYEVGRSDEVDSKNAAIKKRRNDLKRVFTEVGQPGTMFRGVFDKLCDELKLPEWHQRNSSLFKGGLTHILPSFFNLLIHLQNQGRQFTIIFRTFGDDAQAICEEMNMFCTGQHPRYPNVRMDGSDGRTDLRLSKPDSLGMYNRFSLKEDGSMLLIGANKDQMSGKKMDKAKFVEMANKSSGALLTGFKEIQSFLLAQTSSQNFNRAYVFRDYYPFWKSRNERSNAGKLFLLDSLDRETLKVFFDDNIGHTNAHIVDPRDVQNGQSLPFKDVAGKHLFKVEPLNAILDPHYFVRATHECAVNWLKAKKEDAMVEAHQNAGYRQIAGGLVRGETVDPRPQPIINTSRRARQLWSVLHVKIMALVFIIRRQTDLESLTSEETNAALC